MARLRRQEPEDRILRCNGRRGRSSVIFCEQEALHYLADHPMASVHVGRDQRGRWHCWPVVAEFPFFCQVVGVNIRWLECPVREGGGFQCEAQGPHEWHVWGDHTVLHERWGNGNSCLAVEERLRWERERSVEAVG
jgi:hypothetical protein